MNVCSLGSGSAGNCLLVEEGGTRLLIDFGFSCRHAKRLLAGLGVETGSISGVLFTHDHSDHCKGLATFHKCHPEIPLFANGGTADAIAALTGVDDGWQVFENGDAFSVGDVEVAPFPISHDAADPVGYMLNSLFVATDLGCATLPVKYALSRARSAVLESNHDPILLEKSDRPLSLKSRIRGRSGHLSNEDAAALVAEANPAGLNLVLLAHLSRECNAPHLAVEAMERACAEMGRADVSVVALEQDVPSPRFEV